MPNTYRIDVDASAINNAMNQVAKLDQHFDALIASVAALNSTVTTNFKAIAASTGEVASSTKTMLTEMEKGYKVLSEGVEKGYSKALGKLISETDTTVKHLVGKYDKMARDTSKAMGKQNSVVIASTRQMNKDTVKNLKEMHTGFREEVGGIKAVFYELMREAKANTDGTVSAFKAMSTGVRDDLKSVNTALRSTIATVLSFKRSMRDNMGDAVKQLKSTTSSMSTEMAFLRGDIQKLSRQFDKSTKEMVKANQQMADEVTQALIRIKQEQQYLNKHTKKNITSLGDLWREFRRGVATVMAAYYAIRMISAAFRAFIDHTLLMEGVNKRFASMSGGLTEGVKVLGDLKKAAAGMGLEYKSLFEEYSKFYAATKNNPILAKESMAIFEGVTAAGAALGLTNEKMKLVTYALMQMASKGRVLSEEMTRQLGDNLPGALQIASRSLGLTTAEFVKMMQEGNILAEDFLPAFGREMKRQFGDVAVSNIHSTQGALNELNNALFELKEFLMTDMGGSAFFRSMLTGFAGIVDSIKTAISYWANIEEKGSAGWKKMQLAGAKDEFKAMGLGSFTIADIKALNALPKMSLRDVTPEQLLAMLGNEDLQGKALKSVQAYIKSEVFDAYADQTSVSRLVYDDPVQRQNIDVGRLIVSRMREAEGQRPLVVEKLAEVDAELAKVRGLLAERRRKIQEENAVTGPYGNYPAPMSAFRKDTELQGLRDRLRELEGQRSLVLSRLQGIDTQALNQGIKGLRPYEKELENIGGEAAFWERIPQYEDFAIKGFTYGRPGEPTARERTFKAEYTRRTAGSKEIAQALKFVKESERFAEREFQLSEKLDGVLKLKENVLRMEAEELQKMLKMVQGSAADYPGLVLLRDYDITQEGRDEVAKELEKVAERYREEIAKEQAEQKLKLDKVMAGQLKKYAEVTGVWDTGDAGFQNYFKEWMLSASEPEKQAEMEDILSRISTLKKYNRTELQKAMDNQVYFQTKAIEYINKGIFTKEDLAPLEAALDAAVKEQESLLEAAEKEREAIASRAEYRKKKLYNLVRGFIGDMTEEAFLQQYELLTPGQQKALEDAAKGIQGNIRRSMTEKEKLEQDRGTLSQQQAVLQQAGFTWADAVFQEAMDRKSEQIEALRIQHDESLQKMIKMVDSWEERFIDAFMNVVKTGKFAFADLIESMLMDMARVEAQKALSPIFETVMGAFLPGVMKDRATEKRVKAEGGVIGGDTGTDTVSRAEAFLDYVPTFHSGGIVGHDELQATLKKGEGVFTKKQMDAIGGALDRGAVSINIVNNSPVEVSASVNKSDPRQIDILIRDKVRGMFNSGDMDGVMNNNFGMRRSPR